MTTLQSIQLNDEFGYTLFLWIIIGIFVWKYIRKNYTPGEY